MQALMCIVSCAEDWRSCKLSGTPRDQNIPMVIGCWQKGVLFLSYSQLAASRTRKNQQSGVTDMTSILPRWESA